MDTSRGNKLIVFIEDDSGDHELTRRAIENAPITLQIIADSAQALSLLRRGEFANSRPDLVLLDLNMPGVDGKRILEEIRKDFSLYELPVVIFSTSRRPEDVNECYDLGCNSFVTKPLDAHAFMRAIQTICSYWLECVTLPMTEVVHV